MAIPSTGPVSLSTVQNEFGGSNPISLSEYYRGGARVPNTGPNQNISTSGAISLGSFRGSVAYIADLVPDPIDWSNGSSVDYTNGYAPFSWPDKAVTGISEAITLRFSTGSHYFGASQSGSTQINPNPEVPAYDPINASGGLVVEIYRNGNYITGGGWTVSIGSPGQVNRPEQYDVVVNPGDVIRLFASVVVDPPQTYNRTNNAWDSASVQVRNLSSGNTLIDEFNYSLSCERKGF